MATLPALLRVAKGLLTRVQLVVSRAVLRSTDDSQKLQELEVTALFGERMRSVERFQQYGLTAVPHDGAEVVLVFPLAAREHPLAIAVDDRAHRPTGLAKGEVQLYDDLGTKVHLKRGGELHVTAPTKVLSVVGSSTVTQEGAKLTLAVGASSITIEPSKITIKSAVIDLVQ